MGKHNNPKEIYSRIASIILHFVLLSTLLLFIKTKDFRVNFNSIEVFLKERVSNNDRNTSSKDSKEKKEKKKNKTAITNKKVNKNQLKVKLEKLPVSPHTTSIISHNKKERKDLIENEQILEPVDTINATQKTVIQSETNQSKVNNTNIKDTMQSLEYKSSETLEHESTENANIYVGEFGRSNGPRFLKRVIPSYPPFARRRGKEGKVTLQLMIDESGKLINIEVIEKPGFGFELSAIDAIRKSTFLPAIKDGKAVRSRVILPVRFVLK